MPRNQMRGLDEGVAFGVDVAIYSGSSDVGGSRESWRTLKGSSVRGWKLRRPPWGRPSRS